MTRIELENFATGHGYLHNWQMKLARDDASSTKWLLHVGSYVIPAYRRHKTEPYDGMAVENVQVVAKRLRAYYKNLLGQDQ